MGHWFTGEVNKALSSPPQLHSHCGLSTHVARVSKWARPGTNPNQTWLSRYPLDMVLVVSYF